MGKPPPRVHYPRDDGVEVMHYPRERRKKRGCSVESSYAKSLQGICKVFFIILGALIFIIIGASPYARPIFVLEGVTWPFHIVMLVIILSWLAVFACYIFFLAGQHLEYPHIPWPTWELRFNIGMLACVVFAAILEFSNIWRWDMSQGLAVNGNSGGSQFNQLSMYGFRPGMTMSQNLNFNSYCTRYPRDCNDYFALMAGHNSYYGNHIFAAVLLILLLITQCVATFFSVRTWRVFKRDMSKGGVEPEPKPSMWDRIRYRAWEMTNNINSVDVRDRLSKMVGRSSRDEGGNQVDVEAGFELDDNNLHPREPLPYVDEKPPIYSESERSHKSRHSSSTHGRHRNDDDDDVTSDRRSRSSSGNRSRHRHERRHEGRRGGSTERSRHRSTEDSSSRSNRSSHSASRSAGRGRRDYDDDRSSSRREERSRDEDKKPPLEAAPVNPLSPTASVMV